MTNSPNKLNTPPRPPTANETPDDAPLARGLGLTRETGNAYYRRALQCYQDGDLETAIIDLSEAIHHDRGYADYYAVRGLFYVMQLTQDNRPTEDDARLDLYYALKLNKRTWLAHYALGLLEFRTQNYEEALDHFDAAISFKPKRAETLLYRAVTRYQLGDLENAGQDIERALLYLPTADKRRKEYTAWQKEIRAGLGKDKKDSPKESGRDAAGNIANPAVPGGRKK